MTTNLVYAGIGSRETPQDVRDLMFRTARRLHAIGWTLRTGGALGADTAFLAGCITDALGDAGPTLYELYLPWPGYTNVAPATLTEATAEAYDIAAEYHPMWRVLKLGPRRLHARNVHVVLGRNCDHPVKMIICWTPDGSLDGEDRDAGGTGMALRIAADRTPDALVFNLARTEHRTRIERVVLGGALT